MKAAELTPIEVLDQTILTLCSRHHALVHEGGFRIEKDYRDRWMFVKPDGIAVPDGGYVYR